VHCQYSVFKIEILHSKAETLEKMSLIALKEPGVIGLKEPLGSGDFGVSERATD
jgi:hypothetical protein